MSIVIGKTVKLNDIRHFSISRSSCTYATPECKKYCYGAHGRFLFHWVTDAYEHNYRASKEESFTDLMNEKLSINERFFRIHAVGDFYSVEYFKKWVQITKTNPHITFMAYTRNPEVFDIPRPDNFRLLHSLDKPEPSNHRMAVVVHSSYKKAEHLTSVSFDDVEYRLCTISNCIKCLACWLEDFNIAFPQKYPIHDNEEI